MKITLQVDREVHNVFKVIAEGDLKSDGEWLTAKYGDMEVVIHRWRNGEETVCCVETDDGRWILSRYEDDNGDIFLSVRSPYSYFTLTFSFYHTDIKLAADGEKVDLRKAVERLCTF